MEEAKRCFPGWEVVRRIGRGTFGNVYEIKRMDGFGDVGHSAMKLISIPTSVNEIDAYRDDGYDDASLATLFRTQVESIMSEFRIMAKLRGNSNIVSYEDHAIIPHENDPGWDILIRMELLTSLPNYFNTIQRDGMVEIAVVIKLGEDICKALELCERHQIIHRDIKPQNILISPNGDFKLGDFGIARTVDHTTKATKTGTYGYMAPEVYKAEPYNASADICSLGLVMYWMLNARRGPFQPLPPAVPTATQNVEALDRRMNGEALPRPLHGSDALCGIVLKACAYDPNDRFASPAEMRKALEGLAKTVLLPVTAVPATEEEQEATVGPFTQKEEEPDKTVGLFSTVGPMTARENKPQTSQSTPKRAKVKKEIASARPVSRKKIGIALGAVAAVALLAFLGISLSQDTTPMEENAPVLAENQVEWSEWTTVLPEGVDETAYEVESRTAYRSREQESTTSTMFPFMLGWEKVAQTRGDGDYEPWSQWTAAPVQEKEGRQVETETQYRSRDLETAQSDSKTMEGWELSETTYTPGTEYQNWTGWTNQVPSREIGRQIENKTQYRYRDRETTTSTNESMSGWICYNTEKSYGSWCSWENYLEQYPSYTAYKKAYEALGHEVEWRDMETGKTLHHMTHKCYPEDGGPSTWNGYDISGFTSLGGGWYSRNKYGVCDTCNQNKWYHTSNPEISRFARHRAVTTTYYYERYGAWSKWSESAVTETANRDVEKATTYRYRDLEQIPTYHFQRWGPWTNWSTEAAESTDTRQVQEKYAYRYRDISTEPTYYFIRWGDWSDYTVEPLSETETCQVETTEQFRYRLKPEAGETASIVYQQNQVL